MLIEKLSSLIAQSHPGGYAYVPDAFGKQKRQGNAVCVVYSPNGKVYTYKGTIHDVAERLGLIPSENNVTDAERIVRELSLSGTAIGYASSIDTVRYTWHGTGKVVSTHSGTDEYDHPMAVYSIVDNDPWLMAVSSDEG